MPKDTGRRFFFFWWCAVMAPLYVWYRMYHMKHRMPILDCDEVYNYWEPLHFMLFGTGHQTWEYHADYALRTYAYLVPLQLIARYLYIPFLISSSSSSGWGGRMGFSSSSTVTELDPKAQLFLLLRQSVAGTTAVAELLFLYAVWRYYYNEDHHRSHTSSTTIPVVTAVLLLTCTGMHHAAGALLPSATWMALWCLCAAGVLSQQHTAFVVCAVVGTLATGWPFGCVCVLPMALYILHRECVRRRVSFVATIGVVTLLVQGVVLAIDFHYYGVLTLPTWNIVQYNAGGNGDELYGVEPVSYYLKNLLLNGNAVFVLGALALPVYIGRTPRPDGRMASILASLPAWLLLTLPRPHKEERFLFPIYPVLVLGAAVTVDAVITYIVAAFRRRQRGGSKPHPSWNILVAVAHVMVWTPLILVSLSRSWALHQYYGAPLEVYRALATQTTPHDSKLPLVCTCGEWYRYPSSFLLPDAVVQVPVGFLPSSFTGQLPQPFSTYGSQPESRALLQPFNDRNVEQRERYVTDVTRCGWLVDLNDSDDCRAQFNTTRFTKVAAVPFLDGAATTSTLHRTLYLPYWHERARRRGQVVYRDYTLYKIEHDDAKQPRRRPEE